MHLKEGREGKTLLVISDDQAFHREVSETVRHCELQTKVKLIPVSYDDSSNHAASMVLIDISEGEMARVEFARHYCAAVAGSGTKVICAGSNLNVDNILYLLKLGVHHFLKRPLEGHEFKSLIFSLLTETPLPEQEVPAKPRNGKIITVYSLKGGSGVTLLSINIALALLKASRKNDRVAICDLAPQAGDVSTYLNLDTKYTLRDLIDSADHLDFSLLEGVMANHESGLHVLTSPALDQEALSTHCIEEWRNTLQLLKHHHDFTIIDSAHTDENLLQTTLRLSDAVILMGNLDVPSLKGILFGLTKLNRLHIEPQKIKIIINRFNAKNQLDIKEFSRNAKHPIDSKLPNDYSICIESINTGKPISLYNTHSEIGKKIKELADQIRRELLVGNSSSGNSEEAPPPLAEAPKKGLWGLL